MLDVTRCWSVTLLPQFIVHSQSIAGSKDSEVVVVDHLLKQTTDHEATASAHRLTK